LDQLGGPSAQGGCCFLILLLVGTMAGCIANVEFSDRRATQAAELRCTQNQVLEILQPDVWQRYLKQSPPPSFPPDPVEVQQSRSIEQHQLREALGFKIAGAMAGDDNVLTLSNTDGAVARLRYVSALSVGFSFEGPRALLYSCYDQRPKLYHYSYLFL
jgi:hypothetical protein